MCRVSKSFSLGLVLLIALACATAAPQKDNRTRIQKKVEQVEATFPKWVESGGNPRTLEPLT